MSDAVSSEGPKTMGIQQRSSALSLKHRDLSSFSKCFDGVRHCMLSPMVMSCGSWPKGQDPVQSAEMSFLRRVAGRSLRDKMRSSVTREEFRVEPLLLDIERSQLRWLGHLFWVPPWCLPGAFRARPTRRRPWGRPRTRWRDYVSRLDWERLGIPPEEQEEVSREREVWASLLRLLPLWPGSG